MTEPSPKWPPGGDARHAAAERAQMPRDPAVRFREAAVQLGGHTVWSNLSLEIGYGEFVGVLGPNGAGKSTLVKAMLGLVPLAAGGAMVLGRPPGEAGRAIGYLPQRRNFDPGLRIRGRDIVQLGSDGHRWGLPLPGRSLFRPRRTGPDRVDEVIDMVGATHYANRPIGEISGGEQQRLLIAQALVHDPKLLLLDEPLDSLDLANQSVVAALVSEISRANGIAVVIVAHDVNPIAPYLDGVVYIARGGAVSGRPEQVIESETLSELYDAPVEVLRTSDGRLVVVGQPDPPAHHADRHAPRQSGRNLA